MTGRRCVVVGGGAIGTRKVQTLLGAGADITVVAPRVTAELAREIDEGRVRWHRELVRREHFDGACLVVMATDDVALNGLGARIAGEIGALACDASSAGRSDVIFGALLHDDGMTIATFSDGTDPAKARRLRDEIGRLLSDRAPVGADHGSSGVR